MEGSTPYGGVNTPNDEDGTDNIPDGSQQVSNPYLEY